SHTSRKDLAGSLLPQPIGVNQQLFTLPLHCSTVKLGSDTQLPAQRFQPFSQRGGGGRGGRGRDQNWGRNSPKPSVTGGSGGAEEETERESECERDRESERGVFDSLRKGSPLECL
ncbi:hypothetical protein ANANG_G00195160, partial [Anguilla anguilla]